MTVLRCKSCGGALNIIDNVSVVDCEYCGLKQTLPKLDDEKITMLFDRANFYRSKNEFDKASIIYENIVSEKGNEAEAHWGLCLCKYGIEYVTDPKSNKKIPTCHRTQFKSIFEDADYKNAVENADLLSKKVYEEEASYIDKVQKNILSISSKEKPFDIFICYKETAENGERTVDSVLAQDIYTKLTNEGYKVFFSRITLEDKLGTAYEPYIFAALNSAKIMLVIGTRPENFNAIWVKNEWSRYIEIIEQGKDVSLIPCYKDMSPYELPDEFSSLQAQDLGKVGAMQDLLRGIKKIHDINKEVHKGSESSQSNIDINSLMSGNANSILRRGYIYLEDGDFSNAKDCFNKSLDMNPELSSAYWGLVLTLARCKTNEEFIKRGKEIEETNEYKNALRFADAKESVVYEEIKNKISQIITHTVNSLKDKKYEVIKNCGAIEELEKSEASIGDSVTRIGKLIEQLSNLEDDIKQCIEECKSLNDEPLKNIQNDISTARKIEEKVTKSKSATDEEKQSYDAEISGFRENLKNNLAKTKQNKKEQGSFIKLNELLEKHSKLIRQIDNIKTSDLNNQEKRFADFIAKINNIVNEYDKAVTEVLSGDYTLAKKLL